MSSCWIKTVERTAMAYFIREGDRDISGCFDFLFPKGLVEARGKDIFQGLSCGFNMVSCS